MLIPAVEDLEKEGDVERCDDDDGHGRRSSGPLIGDFPFRPGAALIQGVSEQRRTVRHRLVHGAGVVGLQRGLVVISFSVWTFQ